MKTILLIGNKFKRFGERRSAKNRTLRRQERGLSFFEVMVTIIVLSTGVVMVTKALLSSLFYQDHLLNRLYAMNFMEDKMALFQMDAAEGIDPSEKIFHEQHKEVLNNKLMTFESQARFSDVLFLEGLMQADMTISWQEGDRRSRISRGTYVNKKDDDE